MVRYELDRMEVNGDVYQENPIVVTVTQDRKVVAVYEESPPPPPQNVLPLFLFIAFVALASKGV